MQTLVSIETRKSKGIRVSLSLCVSLSQNKYHHQIKWVLYDYPPSPFSAFSYSTSAPLDHHHQHRHHSSFCSYPTKLPTPPLASLGEQCHPLGVAAMPRALRQCWNHHCH